MKDKQIEEILRMSRAGKGSRGSGGEKILAEIINTVIMSGLSVAAVGGLDRQTTDMAKRLLTDEDFRNEVCWRFHWGDHQPMPEKKEPSGMKVEVQITQDELKRINSIN